MIGRISWISQYVPRRKSVPCSPSIDTQTDTHESDYCGHPFRVSGVFPSTYHQGSAKKNWALLGVWENTAHGIARLGTF